MLCVLIVICMLCTSHQMTIICLFICSDVSDFSEFVVVVVVAIVAVVRRTNSEL